jgi:hypothetical protein
LVAVGVGNGDGVKVAGSDGIKVRVASWRRRKREGWGVERCSVPRVDGSKAMGREEQG